MSGPPQARRNLDTSPDEGFNPWPQASHPVLEDAAPFEVPYRYYGLIYMDNTGRIRCVSSPSIQTGYVFSQDIKQRFADSIMMVPGGSNSRRRRRTEYETEHQQRRQRQRIASTPAISTPEEPEEPEYSTENLEQVGFEIGDREMLDAYYEKAFKAFQQLNCRQLAKAYIKMIEPRKQVRHPYNGGRGTHGERGDPEKTKPKWWPIGVPHREPDHLQKDPRIKLLTHILRNLGKTHEVTADKLEQAGKSIYHLIIPKERLLVLEEIYRVRRVEESFERGGIDPTTTVYVFNWKGGKPDKEADSPRDMGDSESQRTGSPFRGSETSSTGAVSPHEQGARDLFPFPQRTSFEPPPVAQQFPDPDFSHFRMTSVPNTRQSPESLGYPQQPSFPTSPVDQQIQGGIPTPQMNDCPASWPSYQASFQSVIFNTPDYGHMPTPAPGQLMPHQVSMAPATQGPTPSLIAHGLPEPEGLNRSQAQRHFDQSPLTTTPMNLPFRTGSLSHPHVIHHPSSLIPISQSLPRYHSQVSGATTLGHGSLS
ncbi:hypothetical protein AJ80_07998 [Polytolypa hystricis UAMH7299]|uniref:Subtelomeric hrmA-associated cluster protein AFUB-079030/YDR124W-like helical bundle domain-containing protein n=1 Tax=Polytolypa hystricis (strain UAMH7299) TaxID=1447883 RepID=A0A2B7XF96_POLH7|nr:hypothetical protein AJ80_07998 [Polytolypa hystricis UAMH7299]